MKHPARRRFHKAQAPGARISGRSEPSTAPQPRIKSALPQKPACSLSTTARSTITDREQKFRRRQNLFLGPSAIRSGERNRTAAMVCATSGRKTDIRFVGYAPRDGPAHLTRDGLRPQKRPARSRPLVVSRRPVSVARRDRATPAEAVVDAGLDGVLVVLEPGTDDRGRSGGKGGAAEVVILVFGLGGPAGRKHVFETGADGVTVLASSSGGKGGRYAGDGDAEIVIVAERETALAVQQRRTPRVADPARDRAKFVILRGHQNATWEKTAIVVVG